MSCYCRVHPQGALQLCWHPNPTHSNPNYVSTPPDAAGRWPSHPHVLVHVMSHHCHRERDMYIGRHWWPVTYHALTSCYPHVSHQTGNWGKMYVSLVKGHRVRAVVSSCERVICVNDLQKPAFSDLVLLARFTAVGFIHHSIDGMWIWTCICIYIYIYILGQACTCSCLTMLM